MSGLFYERKNEEESVPNDASAKPRLDLRLGFTAGFDTADLKDGKVLIDKLSR